jgi:hypothetical protein
MGIPLVIKHDYIGHYQLVLEESSLRYTAGKEESVIPIAAIKSFTIKPARSRMRPGVITINTGNANAGYFGIGRFALGFSNEITMAFYEEYNEIAHRMQEYIMSYNAKGAATATAADEIRKYKSLCDDGIITLEEFEAKKAALLK